MFDYGSIAAMRVHLALLAAVLFLLGLWGGSAPLPLFSYLGIVYLAVCAVVLPAVLRRCRLQMSGDVLILKSGVLARKQIYLPISRCDICTVWHTPLMRYLGVCVILLQFHQYKILLPHLPQLHTQMILRTICEKTE